MKRKSIVVAALAAALMLAIGVSSPAMAYFTDHHTANGGLKINVEPNTQIHEWFRDKTKHVVIKNNEDNTVPVYVRAGVFSPVEADVPGGNGWSTSPDGNLNEGQGWYYYDTILQPGQEAAELTVTIMFPPIKSETEPKGAVEGDNFNVDVIYEATPVQYREDGTPYADWNASYNLGGE